MKAIQIDDSIPRYVIAKALGGLIPSIYWSGLGLLRCREVPEPQLPGPDWVRVKTRLGGICGSDLNVITLHDSPSTSAYASFPFTLGHENVGTIAEVGPAVRGFDVGERVVVEPVLGCVVRGFDDLCPACARGDPAVCERRTEGAVGAGTFTGYCAATGGSWSPAFVAHESQLLRVPDSLSDESAAMTDPFATALRAVLRNPPPEGGTALVVGAGTIGLCTVAALRALGYAARIVVVAKHAFQADLARQYGADEVVKPGDNEALAQALSARLHKALIGPPMVSGGAEVTYECVGARRTLSTALRFTREGGVAVIIGLVNIPRGIDWTPVWMKEIAVHGSYAYGFETYRGRKVRTFQLALDLMAEGKVDLAPLVTHRFALSEYRTALSMATHKSRHRLVKAVFAFPDG